MVPKPSEKRSFIVDSFEQPHWLLWRTPIRSWARRLVPQTDGHTRLITRMHTVYEPRPAALITVLLMELGDFPMMRRMLPGIRERAEAEHRKGQPADS